MGVHNRGRQADYSGRAVLAPVSSRRVAANHQYTTRRHELDRASPGGDIARGMVRAGSSVLHLSPHRTTWRVWLGTGAPGQCRRGGCRAAEARVRLLLYQALFILARCRDCPKDLARDCDRRRVALIVWRLYLRIMSATLSTDQCLWSSVS